MGAAVTSLLFTVGKVLIGFYLGHSALTSAYGAAASLVVFLIWIYYSAQILLFGAELTHIHALEYGSRMKTNRRASLPQHHESAEKGKSQSLVASPGLDGKTISPAPSGR